MSSTEAKTNEPNLPGTANGAPVSDEPPSKRRRVALACNACRTRKSRCNGARPKCSLCSSLGFDCQYEPTDSSTNVIVKKEYVSDFDSRLKSIEEMLKKHESLLAGHSTSPGHSEQTSTSPHANGSNGSVPKGIIQIDADELRDINGGATATDGMAISFVSDTDSVFFGPSSNIAFTRHILGAMTANNITQPKAFTVERHPNMNSGILEYTRESPKSPRVTALGPESDAADAYDLPPVEEMEGLLKVYFSNTGLLFPFIHENSFMKTYQDFKSTHFTKVRRVWLGLLNIVLAMGSSMGPTTDKSATARGERSFAFCKRAADLAGNLAIRGASIEIVQYLLLSCQYLQSSHRSSKTWNLHGLAVKGAFALGLHSNQTSQRFSPLENEVRKRVWYGCILLDRVLSMTFGRPPCIPEEFVKLPPAEPWPLTQRSASENDGLQAQSTEFFNASITLHRLIGSTIYRLYGQNWGTDAIPTEAEMPPRISELEQDLRRWQSSLPLWLSTVSSTNIPLPASSHSQAEARFRIMLTLRYQNLNILIHRPLLCNALDFVAETSATVPWSNVIAKRSTAACLISAQETINIVHYILNNHSLGAAVLGAWWFTLFYVFNSSLAVFAYALVQRSQSTGPESAKELDGHLFYLHRAVETFKLLDTDNRVVDRCSDYIQYLAIVLQRWISQRNGQQSNGNPSAFNLETPFQSVNESTPSSQGFMAQETIEFDPLPDLNDFLKDDPELAQFFASGILDMQSSNYGIVG